MEEKAETYAHLIGQTIAGASKGSPFHRLGRFLIALHLSGNIKWKGHVDKERAEKNIKELVSGELKEELEKIRKMAFKDTDLPMESEYNCPEFSGKTLDIIIAYLVVSFSGISKIYRYYKVSKIKNLLPAVGHFSILTKFSVLTCFLTVIIEMSGAFKRFRHKDYTAGICKIIMCITTGVTGIAGVLILFGKLDYSIYLTLIISTVMTVIAWIVYILFRKSREEIFLREMGLWK
ncbi:MAG: hypothetical protein ABRQ37_10320 [Candidatus Eremiobacterota bacterium]